MLKTGTTLSWLDAVIIFSDYTYPFWGIVVETKRVVVAILPDAVKSLLIIMVTVSGDIAG